MVVEVLLARGPSWEPPEAIVSCWRGQGRGQSQRSRVWELLGHLSCVLQSAPKHSCLLLLKEAGPEGGGVPSRRGAGWKGPRPGGSRMTGQGLPEASVGRGRQAWSSPAGPSAVWKALAAPQALAPKPPLRSDLNPLLPHPLPSLHFWGWPFQLWKRPKSISLKHSKG